MKVIFLDIDGVMNSFAQLTDPSLPKHEWNPQIMKKYGINLEVFPEFVDRLNRVTDATGARLVLSSSWRLGDLEWWAELVIALHNSGVKGFLLGRTPHGDHLRQRGHEIQAWLDEHKNQKIDSFVILDDDNDMCHLLDRLVRTEHYNGLQDEHVETAIAMLNGV